MTSDPTETAARKWLLQQDKKGRIDPSTLPDFVRNSLAWKRWSDDYEAEQPVDRRQYSALAG